MVHGICHQCGKPISSRSSSVDTCEAGHMFPSAYTVTQEVFNLLQQKPAHYYRAVMWIAAHEPQAASSKELASYSTVKMTADVFDIDVSKVTEGIMNIWSWGRD